MGDVVVVADPVHELAAAVRKMPTPVPVAALRVVRKERRRAAPEVVVEMPWRLGDRDVGRVLVARGQADLDVLHLANHAVENEIHGLAEPPTRSLLTSDLEDHAVLFHRLDDRLPFREQVRHRLLAVDMLLRLRSGDASEPVPVVRGCHDDGVDVIPGDDLAVVGVLRAVRVPVLLVDPPRRVVQPLLIDVAHGHDLRVLVALKIASVPVAHPAAADRRDRDALARGDVPSEPERAARDEIRRGRSGGRRSQELPSRWTNRIAHGLKSSPVLSFEVRSRRNRWLRNRPFDPPATRHCRFPPAQMADGNRVVRRLPGGARLSYAPPIPIRAPGVRPVPKHHADRESRLAAGETRYGRPSIPDDLTPNSPTPREPLAPDSAVVTWISTTNEKGVRNPEISGRTDPDPTRSRIVSKLGRDR